MATQRGHARNQYCHAPNFRCPLPSLFNPLRRKTLPACSIYWGACPVPNLFYVTTAFFFRCITTTIRPTIKTMKAPKRTTAPGMIPNMASSQLVRPSFNTGNKQETSTTAPPSKIPRIPRINTIFPIIEVLSASSA